MRYRKINKIGSGGFGIVYEASIPNAKEHIAIKEFSDPSLFSDDRERFEREVRIQSKLHHPNILPVIDSDLNSDPPWFATPLAISSLANVIADLTFDEERLQFIFRQILEGIKYAHDKHVLHRDLKPHNILLFENDNIKIGDFGLGKRIDPETFTMTITSTHEGLGTLHYASPEQMRSLKSAEF